MRGAIGIAAALVMSIGCGAVVFIDPDAELEASLILDSVERIVIDGDDRSYFHIRIHGRIGIELVQLSATGPDTTVALPLDGAHRQNCGKGQTCLALTYGPGISSTVMDVVLDAPSLGHRNTRRIVVRSAPPHQVSAVPRARNETIQLTITDPMRTIYPGSEVVDDGPSSVVLFPRSFDTIARPDSCGGAIHADDEGWIELSSLPFVVTSTFSSTADPSACVAVRPRLPQGGGAVASRTVTAGAVVTRFIHTYAPPTENSPLVYMPIFNLELPSEARCSEAQTLVRSAIREAATNIATNIAEGAEILELQPLELASRDNIPCQQETNPRIDPDVIGGQIRADVQDAFGLRRRVRVVFIYVTNLLIDMPPALEANFISLRDVFRTDPYILDFMVAIAPERAVRGLQVEDMLPWVATEEPTFRDSIRVILGMSWPFKTSIHTANTVIPLVDEDDEARYQYYRVCSSRPLASHPLGVQQPGLDAIVPPATGPAYTIDLEDRTLVPAQMFSTDTVEVEWEGCESLCDRPAPQSVSINTWLMSGGCG